MRVSEANIKKLKSLGFAKLGTLKDKELLMCARCDILSLWARLPEVSTTQRGTFLDGKVLVEDKVWYGYDENKWIPFKIDDGVRRVNSPALTSIQNEVFKSIKKKLNIEYYGDQIVVKQKLKTEVLGFHRDNAPQETQKINIGIYFDTSTECSGGVFIIPHSHLKIKANKEYDENMCTREENQLYTKMEDGVFMPAEPGDVLAHNSFCIHGSSSNIKSDVTRITLYIKCIYNE